MEKSFPSPLELLHVRIFDFCVTLAFIVHLVRHEWKAVSLQVTEAVYKSLILVTAVLCIIFKYGMRIKRTMFIQSGKEC